ncbi:hypothetical protein ANANG_G00255240 [Anguilla anguilla]|uniref:separase n=1 Tax=Anguilla anguilla TaxID=7936 RepID=A0A9D3LT21_ANGAN|nr:hypothetical protein ANANG_G00255240 [Anguilla anguilla]
MAQVVCFQDFSEQTDCSAVDFTQEALRLLEEEPETTENSDRLKDHKAQALLWFYVCTLERNLQEAKEREQRLAAAREQSGSLEPLGTNDLDYEDKQKRQDSQQVYESLRFNLMAQSKQCQSLDRALELWRALLAAGPRPAVRSSKQTGFSIVLMAALYKLMGKPLQALESYQLAAGLARGAGDAHNCASSLCQSARLLLELGAPELAQVQLEQAEQLLQPGSPGTEGPTPLDVQAVLLRAQLCHSTGQVESGVSLLNQVLEKVGAHPRSKAWYLLRAQALQTVGSYLSLDVSALPPHLRQRIADHGLKTADTALDESMKWLCSLVVTLLGNGLYGAGSAGADARFVDQGDNVLLKWQVLSEVLSCSLGVVAVEPLCCAELLVAKAELELQMAELELSGMDLEQVEGLLDLCTDFGGTEKKAGLKIKAQKGRLPKKARRRRAGSAACRPPRPEGAARALALSLGHAAGCACPCCAEPRLGRVVVRWAAARAELTRRLRRDGAEGAEPQALPRRPVPRRLRQRQARRRAGPAGGAERRGPGAWQPSFLHDLTAKIYPAHGAVRRGAAGGWRRRRRRRALLGAAGVRPGLRGLALRPELALVRAGLLAAQALASILALASKQGCRPEDLFSPRWAWNPPASPQKHKPTPFPSAKKTKEPNAPEAKKAREPAAGATAVPRLKITFPSGKLKAAKASRAPPKSASTPRDASLAFAFDDEVPRIAACTPVPKVEFSEESDGRPTPSAGWSDAPALKTARPARQAQRTRPAQTLEPPWHRPRQAQRTHPRPRKPGRPKKSTALPADSASSAEDCAPRRGRPRKPAAGDEEPERMRSIREEEARQEERSLETSVEELRASDTEEQGAQGGLLDVPDKDFEVLRREPVPHQPMEGLWEIRGGVPSAPLPPHATYPNTGPGGLSLDGVQHLLQEALLSLQHLPPPGLYPQLCGLLALCLGQSDPVATAMLHAQSLGLTARHHMICHLSTRLWKLRKAAAPDLSARLRGLSLDDPVPLSPLQQRLARLEAIFAFPTVEPEAFPHQLGQEFTQQLQHIPPGVTVCLLSVVSGQFGEMGDTVLLSRLERGSPPITMRIPTAHAVLQEMDSVQKQQKVLSSVADKAQWWEGRRALDQRIERLLEEMRDILGCWQGLLLPLTSDPRLSAHAEALLRTLSEYGAQTTEETLKAVLSASPLLSPRDLQSLARGLCAGRMEESLAALQGAVSALKDRTEPQGHVVLVLDKYLQKLPWENISCLRSRTVTRMPSLHFLLGHCALKELDPESVLNGGVDPQQVYYVLNPDANLKDTEERFKEWFTSESAWQGVCGTPPSPDQLQEAVATKDLYIYLGHGAGARFLDRRRLLSQELRAAALLFGCSSAALAVRGELEGAGVILNYLMAGCPLVVGNLWDVTDRDIDRFTTTLLQCWLSAGRGAPLLDHMAPSRQATYLKHLIGAAPVVYGLPVSLR